jgi:hypothetical protein
MIKLNKRREAHLSGRRGESHPPAPTEPGVNLSIHRALVTLVTRLCESTANGRTGGETSR